MRCAMTDFRQERSIIFDKVQRDEPMHCITLVVDYGVVFNFLYFLNFIPRASKKHAHLSCSFFFDSPHAGESR
jgi:hypothetical protein